MLERQSTRRCSWGVGQVLAGKRRRNSWNFASSNVDDYQTSSLCGGITLCESDLGTTSTSSNVRNRWLNSGDHMPFIVCFDLLS